MTTTQKIDGYFKGDAYTITGSSSMAGFVEAVLLEGHKAGETVTVATPEYVAARVASQQAEWRDQQAQFAKLRA